jgi:ElaA protein
VSSSAGGLGYRYAHTDELDARTLYALLELRVQVFVVEQTCPYLELDGRDLEPKTIHLWAERDGDVLAYLRLLDEPDGSVRLGRVCTKFGARGRGLSARLMEYAVKMADGRRMVLAAQSHLEPWYERFGFTRSGEPFVEDGIPHVPMMR